MSIYIGNLSYEVSEDDLEEVVKEYGSVKTISIPVDSETGRPKGFAFVGMETEEEEQELINAMDGAEWMGTDLVVKKAKSKEER